jgi:hypothetical protein
MMKEFRVYSDGDGRFYSDGVTRAFGENRMIKTYDFSDVFSSVQPLMCDPKECNLKDIGTIKNQSGD